jgi:hypothetical protein
MVRRLGEPIRVSMRPLASMLQLLKTQAARIQPFAYRRLLALFQSN